MTTSGNTIHQLSRNQIIEGALRKLQVLAKGADPDAEDISNGAEALNNLVATYQTDGMQLWKRTELEIALVADQRDYTIGIGQTIDEPFPVKMLQANLVSDSDQTSIDMQILSRFDFNLLPPTAAGSGGQPVNITYQPFVNYGVVSVWPTPSTAVALDRTLVITYQSPLEYFGATGDTPDFPQQWANALVYGLAVLLADEYGVPIQDKQWLERQADKYYLKALDGAYEDTTIFFQPTTR